MGETPAAGELVVSRAGELARLEELAEAAADLAAEGIAPATRKAYAGAWGRFLTWAEARGLEALPAAPEAIALYVAELVGLGRRVATIRLALAAIGVYHRARGLPSPTEAPAVRAVVRGARRRIGVAPASKAPIVVAELAELVRACGDGPAGVRDRALLLLGFAGAFRRSELVALDLEDLAAAPEGLIVRLRRSKVDQDAAGVDVGIPHGRRAELCPVRAVAAWRAIAELGDRGPLFRRVDRHGNVSGERLGARAVALVVKRAALAAGLDPDNLGAHSLRHGFCTEAVRAGVAERLIMRQSRHRSVTTFRGYVARAGVFLENAAAGLL